LPAGPTPAEPDVSPDPTSASNRTGTSAMPVKGSSREPVCSSTGSATRNIPMRAWGLLEYPTVAVGIAEEDERVAVFASPVNPDAVLEVRTALASTPRSTKDCRHDRSLPGERVKRAAYPLAHCVAAGVSGVVDDGQFRVRQARVSSHAVFSGLLRSRRPWISTPAIPARCRRCAAARRLPTMLRGRSSARRCGALRGIVRATP
jgi:hypothetical protein